MENQPKPSPTNNKSLTHFLFDQLGKLDRDEITIEKAIAVCKLTNELGKRMDYELKRFEVQANNTNPKIKLRDIEIIAIETTVNPE